MTNKESIFKHGLEIEAAWHGTATSNMNTPPVQKPELNVLRHRVKVLEKKLKIARNLVFNDRLNDGDLDYIKWAWEKEVDGE